VTLTLILLAAYALLLLAVGVRSALGVHTAEDFLLAGRRSSGLDTGGSLAATILGASAILGLAGLSFQRGLTGSWWLLVGVVGLGALYFLAAAAKAQSVYSLPDLLGRWYGPAMRTVASALIFLAWLGVVGAQMNAAGSILAAFLGGPAALWILLAGAVFILYTVVGGQHSVIRTDLYQLGIILAGLAGSALVGLKAVHGFAGLRGALPRGFFSFPLSPGFRSLDLGLLLLVAGSTYLTGPDMLSRLLCSRGVRSARRGILFSMTVIVPAALLVALNGMAARALFPGAPPEQAFPLLMRHSLPPLLAVLVMLALLSAFLSSADTTLLTMTTVLAVDLLRLPMEGGARHKVGSLRALTLLCGAATLAVGIFSGGIIPSLLLSYTLFSGGLFIPTLAVLLGRPMSGRAAVAAALAGGGLALAGKLRGNDTLLASGFAASLMIYLADRLLQRLARRAARGEP
jgi:SSS family solute:Na+ symporter